MCIKKHSDPWGDFVRATRLSYNEIRLTCMLLGLILLPFNSCTLSGFEANQSSLAGGDQEMASPPDDQIVPPSEPPTTLPPVIGNKCERFQPGHYVFLEDDPYRTPRIDGLSNLTNALNKMNSVPGFQGIVFMIKWRRLETSRGQYDFSLVDEALKRVKAQGKHLILEISERSFQSAYANCTQSPAPAYVPVEASGAGAQHVRCIAKIWEPATMDDFIRAHLAVIDRYKSDLSFLGFRGNEATAAVRSFENGGWSRMMKPQLIRFFKEVHAAGPTMMIGVPINWIPRAELNELADALEGLDAGGFINWPDTVPSERTIGNYQAEHGYDVLSAANGSTYGWYNLARERRNRMLIAPDVQAPMVAGTLAAHDEIYRFLRGDSNLNGIGAHIIIWSDYHSSAVSDYLGQIIGPTLKKYNGELTNTQCPF